MKKRDALYLALAVACASAMTSAMSGPVFAANGVPPDAAYNPDGKNKTLWPQPVANSGKLKWNEHARDLSGWATLSYEDHRSIPKPQEVKLEGPLNGDAARGKAIAMNTAKGNCWACHAFPGDPQPGTGGGSLIGLKKEAYSDAKLYQQVWDPRVFKRKVAMPPAGAFGTLTDQEIRDVVAFLQTL